MLKTTRIHHISSIVGHAQRNLDFYAGVLGLRLIKQTLNYDDKSHYHLYFGNHDGSTGIITTFPWNDAVEGEIGAGQVGVSAYGIRPNSFIFWKNRLNDFSVQYLEYIRFNRRRLQFKDPDGLLIELIETTEGKKNEWEFNGVVSEHALIGIEDATVFSQNPEATLKLLTEILGYQLVDQDDRFYLLQITDAFGGYIELSKQTEPKGRMGIGAVHHIAFEIENEEINLWREKLLDAGYNPTPIRNRKFFKSLYFRERGGILIELATKGPGFSTYDAIEDWGKELEIPDHFIEYENEIRSTLMPLFVREVSQLKDYGYRDRYEYEILQKKKDVRSKIIELKSLKQLRKLSLEEEQQLQDLKKQLIEIK